MNFRMQNRHVIDLVFPIAVFFVFAASSLAVLMLAANIYSSQTAASADNDQIRTALSYINEKIRQNDQNGGISVQTLEGRDCLALQGNSNNMSFTTYIYEYEGMLKELLVRDDVEIPLKDGKDIMEVRGFSIEEMDDGLFRLSSMDPDGNEMTLIASERSTL